jgi:hypothetical protein
VKILDFIKSLVPSLKKTDVEEDLRITIKELENIVMPSYTVADEYFKSFKIKSKEINDLQKSFYVGFEYGKLPKSKTFIGEISRRLPNILVNANWVKSEVTELLGRDIVREGLGAKKATLLRIASELSYISRTSIDLLNYVYSMEAQAIGVSSESSTELPAKIIKMITIGIPVFAKCVSVHSADNAEYKDKYSRIPDIGINTTNSNMVSSVYDERDLDPMLTCPNGIVKFNPIYNTRMMIARWQSERYVSNKEKKKVLELRILHLKLLNDKKEDPKLEKEIEYIQNRVDKIDRYLHEVEDDLNG